MRFFKSPVGHFQVHEKVGSKCETASWGWGKAFFNDNNKKFKNVVSEKV